MSKLRKHNEDEVVASLRKKNDVKVTADKTILVLNGKSKDSRFHAQNDLGNGSWGKIDFLVKYCGYTQFFVTEF